MFNIHESYAKSIGLSKNQSSPTEEFSIKITSYEMIKNELQKKFGLTGNEAKVFLYLSSREPQKAGDIARALGTNRSETYNILTSLQSKGIITATFDHPIKFMSIGFDKALEILLQNQRIKLSEAESTARYLTELWNSIPKENVEYYSEEKYQILSGINQISNKALQLTKASQASFNCMISVTDMAHLDLFNFSNELRELKDKGLNPRLLITSEVVDRELIKGFNDCIIKKVNSNFSNHLPRFLISDENEVILFLANEKSRQKELRALWTNYSSMVKAFKILFEQIWEVSESYGKHYVYKYTYQKKVDEEKKIDSIA
ncbi:MAG: helix-turn-helix domain-containing protein [Nitrososphaerales archaeon]